MNAEIYQWLMSETYTAAAARGTARFLSYTLPAASIYVSPVVAGGYLAHDVSSYLSEQYRGGTFERTPEIETYEISALRTSRIL